MLQLTLDQFESAITVKDSEYIVKKINEVIPKYNLNTANRLTHWLAQLSHESCGFTRREENLKYSAARLIQVFPRYFNSSNAHQYEYCPEKIANRIYSNRMGNGPESSGDGYRYRGRGYIQLTGKDNYRRMSQLLNYDFICDPDAASRCSCCIYIAAAFWNTNNIWRYADNDDIYSVTRAINGGYIGLDDRMRWLTTWKLLIQ